MRTIERFIGQRETKNKNLGHGYEKDSYHIRPPHCNRGEFSPTLLAHAIAAQTLATL